MKLEQAARSALEALREYRDTQMIQAPRKAITALREALAEQATVSDGLCGGCAKKAADGWALYCVECWEKAEQEPVDGVLPCPFCGDNQPTVFEGSTFRWRVAVCNNCGAYAPEARHDTLAEDQKQAGIESDAAAITAWNTRAAPVEPVEQEPVAWLADGQLFYTKDVASIEPLIPLYAAPVRTKDLTDDEVMQTYTNFNLNELSEQSFMIGFARAVIAKDREKNK